tara:strand:- start:1926 stop:2090 length:165 start_codon:yes stop_codon:yes gene_type:complete
MGQEVIVVLQGLVLVAVAVLAVQQVKTFLAAAVSQAYMEEVLLVRLQAALALLG